MPPSAVRGEQIVSALWPDGLLLNLPEPFTYHALQLAPSSREWVKTGAGADRLGAARAGNGCDFDLVLATDEPQACIAWRVTGGTSAGWAASRCGRRSRRCPPPTWMATGATI